MTSGELSSTLPQSGLRRLRWLLVLLVVAVGGGSSRFAWRSAEDTADREDQTVAQEAADLVERTVDLAELGLAGAGAIVPPTGPISVGTFEAYARDVLASSSLQALAFEPVVFAAGRTAFEADIGGPIIDRGPNGATPAPPREVYLPVRSVVPQLETNRGLVGFDLTGDPVRLAAAEQARDSGEVVFSEPVPSQPSGTTSFFLVKALYRPGFDPGSVAARRTALVGFVSSAYTSRLFGEAIAATLPEGTAVELRDGDVLLADTGDAAGGVAQEAHAGRRTWMLLVDGPAAADHGVAVALGALTLVVGGGLAFLFVRGTRHDREVRRSTVMIARTADLAQELAGAQSVEEVEREIFHRVPAVLGARVASLGYVDRETDTIVVRHPEGGRGREMAGGYDRAPMDVRLPITEVVKTDRPLLLRDHEAWRRHTTLAVVAAVKKAGLEGAIVQPIHSASGRVMATLSIAWARPIDLDEATHDTVATVTEICQYALQRATATDDAARRATELATLAELLASATTTDAVGRLVTTFGRAPVEAAGTSIGLIEDDRLVMHHGETVPDEYRRTVTAPALRTALAVTEVARTGTMLLFETQDAYVARYPTARTPLAGARAILPLRRADGTPIGVIAHLWNGPREFDPALVSTLTTMADMTGQAVERARLAQAQAEDARHTEALARLAQGLTSRTNSEAVMAFLTQGVLGPLDAFHAAVAVIEGDRLRRHFTPGVLREAPRSLPADTPLDADTPLSDAARTGEAVLLPDDAALAREYPHLVEAWRSVGFQATANLPLRDGHGRLIGALGLAWDHPVEFDADLRDRLSTVAGIAGQTLERTQLVDRLREDARRSESLAELAEVLATARSSDEVAAAAANQAASVVDADAADVAVLDPISHRVRIHLPSGLQDGFATTVELDPTTAEPHLDVLRDGGLLTFVDREAYGRRYPHLEDALAGAGIEAVACVELRDSAGNRLGVLGIGWHEPLEFDDTVLAGLRSVSELCSQALERAQLSDAEHRLVTTLQSSVLAPLPDAPGLACAARYLPAARGVGMGGDWYEGVVLPKDRYAVVIGDVAGHGITAVGQMAQFRAVLGSLIRLDVPLSELFPLATAVVHGESPIATAIVAVIDQADGVLRYAAAGHPPPLLRLPDGEVVTLEGGRHPLLGVPTEARPAGEHPFPPGATLLCYTDGLIERRGEVIEDSIERLARALAAATTTEAETLADDILATLLPEREMADDVALAVITRA